MKHIFLAYPRITAPVMRPLMASLISLTVILSTQPVQAQATTSNASSDTNLTLPPDPGAAGKQTLEGIDSDGDGVRDDVQIAITEKYPLPEQAYLRNALLQSAKAFQATILAGASNNESQAFNVSETVFTKAIRCEIDMIEQALDDGIIQGREGYDEANALIRKLVVNTDARLDAYMNFNQLLSGYILGIYNATELGPACE